MELEKVLEETSTKLVAPKRSQKGKSVDVEYIFLKGVKYFLYALGGVATIGFVSLLVRWTYIYACIIKVAIASGEKIPVEHTGFFILYTVVAITVLIGLLINGGEFLCERMKIKGV